MDARLQISGMTKTKIAVYGQTLINLQMRMLLFGKTCQARKYFPAVDKEYSKIAASYPFSNL
jgi:hypothetical protein